MTMVYAQIGLQSTALACPCWGWLWPMPWWPMPWWSGFAWLAAFAVALLVAALVLLFALPLLKHRHTSTSEALRILDERLARGEITEEEYKRLKKLLESEQ